MSQADSTTRQYRTWSTDSAIRLPNGGMDFDFYDDNNVGSLSPEHYINIYYNATRAYSAIGFKPNLFPVDENERYCMDCRHDLFNKIVSDLNPSCPPLTSRRVIDIGTGTEIWAIDYADENPDCLVVGFDLVAMQPIMVPTNLQFVIADAEENVFEYNHNLALIHIRGLNMLIGDWLSLMQNCYQSLGPGGLVQIVELDYVYRNSCNGQENFELNAFFNQVRSGCKAMGRNVVVNMNDLFEKMESTGFVKMEHKTYQAPLGSATDVEQLHRETIRQGLDGFSRIPFLRGLKMDEHVVAERLQTVRRELEETEGVHCNVHVIRGFKSTIEFQ